MGNSCKPLVVPCCPVAGAQYYNPKPIKFAVYHYYKNISGWLQCYNEAMAEYPNKMLSNATVDKVLAGSAALGAESKFVLLGDSDGESSHRTFGFVGGMVGVLAF